MAIKLTKGEDGVFRPSARSLLLWQLKRRLRLNSLTRYQGGGKSGLMKKAAVVGVVGVGAYVLGVPVVGYVFGTTIALAWGLVKIGLLAVGGLYLWSKWLAIKEKLFG